VRDVADAHLWESGLSLCPEAAVRDRPHWVSTVLTECTSLRQRARTVRLVESPSLGAAGEQDPPNRLKR
jgi:hypothetical protein